MSAQKVVFIVCLTGLCLSCSQQDPERNRTMDDTTLQQDLLLLQNKRIYFGHQSVGGNIVAGIKDLLAAKKDVRLNLIAYNDTVQLPEYFFAESYIGENTKPASKCSAFMQNVGTSLCGKLDLALMKFCYADITKDTDVRSVFNEYAAMMDSLKSRCPHVRFVHVTVPLMGKPVWWKRIGRAILGREDNLIAENIKRNAFNAMLTEHYGGEPLFDLAAIESTLPDGRRETFEHDGKTYYQMVGDYTVDGGHLTESARKMAARAMIHTLASAVRGN